MALSTSLEEKGQPYHLLLPVRIHTPEISGENDRFFYLHWHREFEFCLVTEGTVLFQVEEDSFRVEAGGGILIGSNRLHAASSLSGAQCGVTAIVFRGSFFCGGPHNPLYEKYVAPVRAGRLCLPVTYSPRVPWQRAILALLRDVAAIPADLLRERELLVQSRLVEAWYLCYAHGLAQEPPGGSRRRSGLEPVLEHIHSHYMEDLTLPDLAALVSLSPGQLCRRFKEETGTPPISYLLRHRILQSCRLLGQTGLPVTQIANATGFNNISYYNKVFRAMIGCTPTVYRQRGHTAGQ